MLRNWSRRDFAKLGAAGLMAGVGCQSDPAASVTPSPPPAPKIIDPHVHVWVNDPRYPWPAENTNPPKEDYTPEMLLALMEQHGVAHTVIVPIAGTAVTSATLSRSTPTNSEASAASTPRPPTPPTS
jgi:hypothetical protein